MSNREIAEKLGISPAALSLILNGKPGVSDATRKKVLRSLEQMGLSNLVKTRDPSSGKKSISFVIYKKSGEILDLHPFFLLLMESIERRAMEYGCSVLLNMVDCRNHPEAQLQHLLELEPVGAIVFATEMTEEDMTAFEKMPFPVVALDNDLTAYSCNTVAINNEMGTIQAMKYLSECGIHRVGYLRASCRISSFEERERGFLRGAGLYGMTLSPEDIYTVRYTEEGSYRDLMEILKPSELPEAFVCDDDTIAAGALRAFREYGISVPEDVSLIGFNDRPECDSMVPPLTSVNVSRQGLAREAVDELMRIVQSREKGEMWERSRKIRVGTAITVRSSVRNK